MNQGKLFVISGPSGSGKTTIVKKIVGIIKNLSFSVSCTTRAGRENEIDGVDYKFISVTEFQRMTAKSKFIEWSQVHGNLYGTPAKDIIEANKAGKDIILDIDVKGASEIKKNYNNSVFIFILPKSLEELRTRLAKRKNESNIDINTRIQTAKDEIAQIINYDYIIINSDIDESTDILASIIKSERHKRRNMIDYVYKNFDVFG